VTVLFADVVRSMDIAAAEGPERLREIMAELLDRSTAVVKHYGGSLSQFTGDGIMAVFGAPITLEDHAFRACMSALDIQKEVGTTLKLRIGLNSGQVIAGEIGSSTASYITIGQQAGMAQRMESVAPPGGVMLSESTARLVEGTAVLDEPELVHIKGSDDPVLTHRLLAIGVHQRRRRSESKLVGRGRKTTEILAAAEQSSDNLVLDMARAARGVTLVQQDGPEREAGRELLAKLGESIREGRFSQPNATPVIELHIAREKARLGDDAGAIELCRAVLDELFSPGGALWAPRATAVLMESLLRRGGDGDLREAHAAVDHLAAMPTESRFLLSEIWLLWMRALLARTEEDTERYRDNYRKMATDLGFEGHMAWAEAMP
jgi:class 3 adenylate cyclase